MKNRTSARCAGLIAGLLALSLAGPAFAAEEITAQPLDAEEISASAPEETGISPLPISVSYEYDYQDVTDQIWVDTLTPQVALETEDFPALSSALEAYNAEKLTAAANIKSEMTEWAQSDSSADSESSWTRYWSEHTLSVMRADSVILSLCDLTDQFGGGIHSDSWYETFVYDVPTGQELKLSDVLTDPDALPEILEQELLQKYDADIFLVEDLAGAIRDEMHANAIGEGVPEDLGPIEAGPAFTLGYDGITFWFAPYELAPYAAGSLTVTMYYDQNPDLVKPEYTRAAENYIVPLRQNETIRLPMDASTLTWQAYATDEYESEWVQEITIDGVTKTEEFWGFSCHCWLMHTGGSNFLLTQISSDNDYQELHVTNVSGLYELSGPEEIPDAVTIPRHFADACPVNPDSVVLAAHSDMLSTYQCSRPYRFDETGTPIPLQPWDDIPDYTNEYWEMALTVKKTFSADTVDEAGDITGSTELSAGTKLHFLRTDNESWVDMTLPDSTIVRLYVEQNWPALVNGEDSNELLDGMMYAG